jgi:hypothetical protein
MSICLSASHNNLSVIWWIFIKLHMISTRAQQTNLLAYDIKKLRSTSEQIL